MYNGVKLIYSTRPKIEDFLLAMKLYCGNFNIRVTLFRYASNPFTFFLTDKFNHFTISLTFALDQKPLRLQFVAKQKNWFFLKQ